MKRMFRARLAGTMLPARPALAGFGPHAAAAGVQMGALTVSSAFLRATPPRAPVGGGCLTITGRGTRDDRLVSVTAPTAMRRAFTRCATGTG